MDIVLWQVHRLSLSFLWIRLRRWLAGTEAVTLDTGENGCEDNLHPLNGTRCSVIPFHTFSNSPLQSVAETPIAFRALR
jgi:hypothetical protein